MTKPDAFELNSLFVEISGAGLPEIDGLYVPSTAPPAKSEPGTLSSVGFWNGKPAWDRADGKAARAAPRFPIPTAKSRGASRGSMGIWPMR